MNENAEQSRLAQFVETFFRSDLIEKYTEPIGHGIIVTCEIAVLVVITGISAGLLMAIIRTYKVRILNILIIITVDILRSVPPLVLILMFYFGLPLIGLYMSSFVVLWLVLSFVLASFSEEIFWAGILSIRQGQWEAARSTGLTFNQALIFVIVPQAIRMTIAPLTNRTIAITKNTALGTVIGVSEILNEASTAQSFSGNATPLMMGALAYILLFIPIVFVGRWIETRFAWRRA